MIELFSEAGIGTLTRFASVDPLLALDYDGTLAPIRVDRDAAFMSDATRRLLEQAASHYNTVIISGRALEDLRRLVGDVQGVELIGNHGAEAPGVDTQEYRRQVQAWRPQLEDRLASLVGLAIEDKHTSLSIHYRDCRPWTVARSAVLDAATGLEGARVVGGKAVINLVPQAAPHKGQALLAACGRWGRAHAIYVGDDETDEDVFRLGDPEHILTVRVGHRSNSLASWFLRKRTQLPDMLRLLIEHRSIRESSRHDPPGKMRMH